MATICTVATNGASTLLRVFLDLIQYGNPKFENFQELPDFYEIP